MSPAAGDRTRPMRCGAPEGQPPRLVARHQGQPHRAPAARDRGLRLSGLAQAGSHSRPCQVPQKDGAVCRPRSRLVLSRAAHKGWGVGRVRGVSVWVMVMVLLVLVVGIVV